MRGVGGGDKNFIDMVPRKLVWGAFRKNLYAWRLKGDNSYPTTHSSPQKCLPAEKEQQASGMDSQLDGEFVRLKLCWR